MVREVLVTYSPARLARTSLTMDITTPPAPAKGISTEPDVAETPSRVSPQATSSVEKKTASPAKTASTISSA